MILKTGMDCQKYPWVYFPSSSRTPAVTALICQQPYKTRGDTGCVTLFPRGDTWVKGTDVSLPDATVSGCRAWASFHLYTEKNRDPEKCTAPVIVFYNNTQANLTLDFMYSLKNALEWFPSAERITSIIK